MKKACILGGHGWCLFLAAFPSLVFWGIVAADLQPSVAADGESGTPPRPPAVEILRTIEDGAGYGAELHRVTIRGTARNQAGEPVEGATVLVASSNNRTDSGFEKLRSQTVTNAAGRFEFVDVQLLVNRNRPKPLPEPAGGNFVVFGTADGYGFTWHRERQYRPAERPESLEPGDRDLAETKSAFYKDEPVEIDLIFEPAATLRGQVTDDLGNPICGATVQVGYTKNLRNPNGYGTWACSYLGREGSTDNKPVRFDAIESLPAEFRETETDEEGRYQVNHLRRDSSYIAMIDPGPTFNAYSFQLATTELGEPKGRVIQTGYAGTLDREFTAPRTLKVRVVTEDAMNPVPGATVTAHHDSTIRHAGAQAETDANGDAVLQLVPGEYELICEPSFTEPLLLGRKRVTVPDDPPKTGATFELKRAAIVVFHAVDAESGLPVSGVSFEYATDSLSTRRPLSSQTVYVDHPKTDDAGILRAYVPPGRLRFFARLGSAASGGSEVEGDLVDLSAGQTTEIVFEVPSPEVECPAAEGRPSIYPREMVEKWDAQADLLHQARMRLSVRHTLTPGDGLDPAKLLEIFRSLDPYKVPDVETIFKDELGVSLQLVPTVLAVEGAKRRVDNFYDSEDWPARKDSNGTRLPSRTSVSNGFEVIHSRGFNNQVSVFDVGASHLHISGLRDFCMWPVNLAGRSTSSSEEKPTLHTVDTERQVRYELQTASGDREFAVRRVCDRDSGFIFEQSYGESLDHPSDVRLYFAPKRHANGLILPSFSVSWSARDHVIHHFEIHVIDDVEVKSQMPPDTFAVAIPAGSMIVDFRGMPRDWQRQPNLRPQQVIVTSPVRDTIAYLYRNVNPQDRVGSKVKYGELAPDLQTSHWLNLDGPTEAPKLVGKVVLIDFWGIGCGPCIAQLSEVQAVARHFADKPFLLIGLHASGIEPEDLQAFAKKEDLSFQIAIDKTATERGWFGATCEAYGVRGIPTAAVLDDGGNLAYLGSLENAIFKVEELLKEEE